MIHEDYTTYAYWPEAVAYYGLGLGLVEANYTPETWCLR